MVSPAFFHCPSGLFCRYSIDHLSRTVFALGGTFGFVNASIHSNRFANSVSWAARAA